MTRDEVALEEGVAEADRLGKSFVECPDCSVVELLGVLELKLLEHGCGDASAGNIPIHVGVAAYRVAGCQSSAQNSQANPPK